MIENYGILGWIVIGLIAGGDRQAAHAGQGPGRLHHHHPARHRRRAAGRLPRPGARLVRPGEGAGFLAAIVGAFLILLIYRLVLRRR